MLRYTGHPFVDVGVATIVEYTQVDNPQQVTEAHLDQFVEWIFPIYMSRTMINYVSGVLFPNFYPFNQSVVSKPQFDSIRRDLLWQFFLALYKPNVSLPEHEKMQEALEQPDEGETCIFSGDKALVRASRELIPMTLGRGVINFVPEGRPNLPISGWCLLALFAMPFGGLNSGGKVWIVHSQDVEITKTLARKNLERNLKTFHIQNLQQDTADKLPNYRFAKTYLMGDLVEAQAHVTRTISLTAYLFTSAAKDARIEIHQLPSSIVSFMRLAKGRLPDAWQAVVSRAWAMQDSSPEDDGKIVYQDRNYFYEDLFSLPQDAISFLRRYLLRQPQHGKPAGKQKLDPRFTYSYREKEVISWELTELFLERVMNMDKDRIRDIRDFADKLADYIIGQDERLFVRLFRARNDYQIRLELQKAANSAKGVLMPYDQFINVFFVDEGETAKPDWYLARDLLMVRIIERLHETNWIESNPELVEEAAQAAQEGSTEE